jgi:endonuclease YncB( thermonuclease family)
MVLAMANLPGAFRNRFARSGQAMTRLISIVAFLGGCALMIGTPAPTSQSRAQAAEARSVDPANLLVMDGDTIRVKGIKPSIRLSGYTSPATKGACANERALGAKAKERLYDLAQTGPMSLQLIPCSCPAGTEGTGLCNYGRSCGILSVNGVDVAKTLISENLAMPLVCGATSCPVVSTPWCK